MDSVEKPVERPPLIQYWHDAEIPDEIGELLEQAGDRNRDLRHLVFDEHAAAALIAEHFTAREEAAFRACAAPAMQSDYFRYCAVYALGGVYCDADAVVSGSFLPLLAPAGQLFRGVRTDWIVTNHLFGFRASGHHLLRLTIEIATSGIETRFCEDLPVVTGPMIFTMLATVNELGSFDAYIDRSGLSRSPYSTDAGEQKRWRNHLEAVRAMLGDGSRVAEAFRGVRVDPYAQAPGIAAATAEGMQYRGTRNHYANWTSSIYR